MRRTLTWALVFVVAAVAAGTAGAAGKPKKSHAASPAAQLRAAKSALDRYRSVDAATADGYKAEGPCESTPVDPDASWWGGAMGIHYVDDALLAKPINPLKPAILTYAPQPDGSLKLLAAEYFKADADQNLLTDNDRPTVFGRAFDGPMKGHAPGMPIHYDLHVWLWAHNPSGLFASWNPAVTCPKG
jgi:hypothetical protein